MVCNFTVGSTKWTVPAGVTEVEVDMFGAAGANGTSMLPGTVIAGGKGGHVKVKLPVTAGQKLQVNAGGMGHVRGGFNGGAAGYNAWAGGGGGASDIRTGAFSRQDRILVAGGGGGGGSYRVWLTGRLWDEAGAGGGGGAAGPNAEGEDGAHLDIKGGFCFLRQPTFEGRGGTSTYGGWSGEVYPSCLDADAPYSGSLGEGGNGTTFDGFGGAGGGGGGGYYGGGGGSFTAGGGGGSGYLHPSINPDKVLVSEKSVNPGDGVVVITYRLPS
jgi:hypothetical protein